MSLNRRTLDIAQPPVVGASTSVYSVDGGSSLSWKKVDKGTTRIGGRNYADPSLAIEAALGWLNGKGGGTMRTYGPGETWTCLSQINWPGDNLSWYSDWGLRLDLGANVDNEFIYGTGIDVAYLCGLLVDGNKANQGVGQHDGINFVGTSNYIHVNNCYVEDAKGNGVAITGGLGHLIESCWFDQCAWNGAAYGTGTTYSTISNCKQWNASDVGFSLYGSHNTVADCISWSTARNGDGASNSYWGYGHEEADAVGCTFNNVISYNNETGMNLAGDEITVSNFKIFCEETQASIGIVISGDDANIGPGIIRNSGSWAWAIPTTGERPKIHNVDIYSDDANSQGVRFNGGDDGYVKDCTINVTLTGVEVLNDSDDIAVKNNTFLTAATGVSISTATCNNTRVLDNEFLSVTTPLSDSGTGTILHSKPFQFTHITGGSAAIQVTSPTGCYVSDAGGTAIVWGQLPAELHQVVRLKVWAVAKDAPVNAGGHMHAEFTFNAGGANEAYNLAANSWGIANKDSEDADYVSDDTIHWLLADADTGDSEISALAAGDSFELLAIYEGASDPDGDTDAKFRVVEVYYV